MKTNTTGVQVSAEDGTIITIQVPVGSMDEPTQRGIDLWHSIRNENGWKLPTRPFVTNDWDTVEELTFTLDWYLGGHEITTISEGVWEVTSEGYYHYIGS